MLVAQFFGALILGAFRSFQYFMEHHRAMPRSELSRLPGDPLLLATCVFLSLPIVWVALFFMVRIQRGGAAREFLALRRFGAKHFLLWTIALAAVLAAGDQFLHWIGDSSGGKFAFGLFLSGSNLFWIASAIVLGAPLLEEPLFRGFMYRGLARSRWTTIAAIIIPNCLWVGLHVQYKWPTILVLFSMGLVFGLARHFSGSTLLPIVLHIFASGFAVLVTLTALHPATLLSGIDFSQNTVLGYTMKADFAEGSGNTREELANYGALLKLDPNNQNALQQRGLIYKRQKKYARALADFTRLQKLSPSDTEALYQRAYVYILQGKYDPSIADLTRILEIDTRHHRAHWLRAFAYEHKGDRKRAIADNLAALKLSPKFGPAISDLGSAYLNNGDYDLAIKEFSRAIASSPQSSDNYNSRAICYSHKKDYDRAIADYDTSLRLDPEYSTAYRNRGIAWERKRNYRKAFADYNRALEIEPDYENALDSLAWLLATCPDPGFRDGTLAVKYAEKTCRLAAWRNPDRMQTLAAALAEHGDFEKAVWWQEKSLELYCNRKAFTARWSSRPPRGRSR